MRAAKTAESSSQWEAHSRLSEDKVRALQQEIISLKQTNFAASMTASTSPSEAELLASKAKVLLNDFAETNQILN